MIKSFLITLSFSTLLFSSQQILLVVSDNFSSTTAKLSCFEGNKSVCEPITVNLGRNGLGWGMGIQSLTHNPNEPLKLEGDGRAPAGIFALTDTFGYTSTPLSKKMPYLYADADLICVDDRESPFYNQIIQASGDEKSFEHMRRKDKQYAYGIRVAHNPQAKRGMGSCIFLHIEKEKQHPTSGCTSMKEKDLKKIIEWLDQEKNPLLIQVPKKYLEDIYTMYPQLKE